MRVFTPDEISVASGSKYLSLLVAAKYARELNALPRDAVPAGIEKKLTTRSLEMLTSSSVAYTLTKRRRRGT